MNYEVTIAYANGDIYKQLFDDVGNAAEYALAAREVGEDDGQPCTTYVREISTQDEAALLLLASRG
jgi:hypothetical protein